MNRKLYRNWRDLVFTNEENEAISSVKKNFERELEACGFPEEVKKSLRLEFSKASLHTSLEEEQKGILHFWADGEPFYRLSVIADDISMLNQTSKALKTIMLIAAQNSSAIFSRAKPVSLFLDFRGSIQKEAQTKIISCLPFIRSCL